MLLIYNLLIYFIILLSPLIILFRLLKGKEDLSRWLVKNGYAVAYQKYSKKYLLDEQYAKNNTLGLWDGTFLRPEEWRRNFK